MFMNALANRTETVQQIADEDPAGMLEPGVLVLSGDGAVRSADERALGLLGCADRGAVERLWGELRSRLEAAGLSWRAGAGSSGATLELAGRRLWFGSRHDAGEGAVLLVRDAAVREGLEADLRLASQMRSLAQISPAVAHDLRAPINAMVFNIEILKETIASGRGAEPGGKDRQLRYVNVLKEELTRLHKSLEIFLSFISPRGDRNETLDLRELTEELAALLVAPARKQQVQVDAELPEGKVPMEGNRYFLRQALLHLSLATLAGVPRQGTLAIRLERRDGHARIRISGRPGADSPASESAGPAPGFDIQPSAGGTLAQLWVARAIVAAHGGEARAVEPPDPQWGAAQAYEVELSLLENLGSENKE
jgi:signal transduction histidine kinase